MIAVGLYCCNDNCTSTGVLELLLVGMIADGLYCCNDNCTSTAGVGTIVGRYDR